jgi:mannosyltransferase
MSGNNTGLAAAFLLCLNVAHIAYAQEARFYSLVVFLCSLSLLLFLRIPHNGARNFVAYAVVSALACYSHFFAVFFLFAQWIALLAFSWRKMLVAISLTLLLIAPALYYMAFRNKGQLAFVPRPHLHDIINLAYFLTADGGKFRKPLAAVYALGCAIAVGGLLLRWRRQKQADWPLTVGLACLLLPIAITFVISFWVPIFYPRYLLIGLPGLVLLAARGLVEITPSWIRAGVAVLIVALSAGCLHWYYSHPKDDWRSLTAYLLKHSKPGDAIVGCPPGAEWPVQYYAAVLSSQNSPRFLYVTPSVLLKDIHDREMNAARVWIVAWHDNEQLKTAEREIAPEYTRVDDQDFYGELSLMLYENSGGKMSRKVEASASNK